MVAAGLLDTAHEHTEAITNMAFSMREEAGKVLEPVNKTSIQVSYMQTSSSTCTSSVTVLMLCLDPYWYPYWPCGGWCGRQEDAPFLSVWGHCEHCQSDGVPRHAWHDPP